MKIKRRFALLFAVLLVICFSACSQNATNEDVEQTPNNTSKTDINHVALGESFTYSPAEGNLKYTVDKVQFSKNVSDFNVDPAELQSYDGVSYTDNGKFVAFAWPEYVNEETGQLAENLLFVLVDITVTNEDAFAKTVPNDNVMDDSWYAFRVDYISLCDTSEQENERFRQYKTVWYAGAAGTAAESLGVNGQNTFTLHPGESVSYQMGFIIGSNDGDYSQFYITNGGGGMNDDGVVYIPVNVTGID